MDIALRNPEGTPPPAGRYSQVARVTLPGNGALLYLAGQIALDPGGEVVAPGDMRPQAAAVVDTIEVLLRAEGATLANVINLHNFVTDMDQLPALREVLGERLPTPPPTSTTVQVARLFRPGAVLETEAVAAVPSPTD